MIGWYSVLSCTNQCISRARSIERANCCLYSTTWGYAALLGARRAAGAKYIWFVQWRPAFGRIALRFNDLRAREERAEKCSVAGAGQVPPVATGGIPAMRLSHCSPANGTGSMNRRVHDA